MIRRGEPKADPAMTREWQNRSRATARAKAAARKLKPGTPRSSLSPVSKRKLEEAEDRGERRPVSSFKRKPAGLVASPTQREKVKGLASIVSGQTPCDPAHLWPTGRGGCTAPECVVPLTRLEHEAFDRGDLDILPALINHGCWTELAHMVSAHQVDPLSMLHRLTGERHEPATVIVLHARRMARELADGTGPEPAA